MLPGLGVFHGNPDNTLQCQFIPITETVAVYSGDDGIPHLVSLHRRYLWTGRFNITRAELFNICAGTKRPFTCPGKNRHPEIAIIPKVGKYLTHSTQDFGIDGI